MLGINLKDKMENFSLEQKRKTEYLEPAPNVDDVLKLGSKIKNVKDKIRIKENEVKKLERQLSNLELKKKELIK